MYHHDIMLKEPFLLRCNLLRVQFCFAAAVLLQEVLAASDVTIGQQFCVDPGFIEHGSRTPSSGVFFVNAVARFRCIQGYRLKGPSKVVCTRFHNGSAGWRPNHRPVCLLEDCLPPYIEDADVSNHTYRPGDFLSVSCHEGFQIRYPDMDNMVSVCQDDGAWDNQPTCQGCLRPLINPHSYMNLSETQFSVPVGTVVQYHCFPGYKLEGAETMECMYNLIWSSMPPRCLDVEVCPLPPMLEHGDYMCHPQPCDRYIHGTVVEFYCDPGYSLANDYKYITCQYGEWFPHLQIYCIKTETTWPGFQDTLLTKWRVGAFTASGVLLALLLVMILKVLQFQCKPQWTIRDPDEDLRDQSIVVVDGVPVLLPTYEEAVSSAAFPPPRIVPPVRLGDILPAGREEGDDEDEEDDDEETQPPEYPGHSEAPSRAPIDTSECETYESMSDNSECGVHSTRASSPNTAAGGGGGNNNPSETERTNAVSSIEGTASTSPSVDIADEIPLVEDETDES
ncbi:sushi domain-containing protein 4 isoform X2 [Engraulis encrasicolus]|uniref:sushi domain-containing protein 4 isoform X2 n=1 Tax=Engraulis encrasicolus TaxID=184585 RepID=UPI002FCEEAC3